MDELIENNIIYCPSFSKSFNIKYYLSDIVLQYKNVSLHYIMIDQLLKSENKILKGYISMYLYNYIYSNLRSDTCEIRYNEINSLYEKMK